MGYSLGRWDDDTLIVDSAGDTDMLEAVCERSSEDWPGSLSDTADRANTRCSGDVNLEERLGKLDADHQIVRDVGPRMLADKLAKLVLPSLTECGAVLEFGSVLGGQYSDGEQGRTAPRHRKLSQPYPHPGGRAAALPPEGWAGKVPGRPAISVRTVCIVDSRASTRPVSRSILPLTMSTPMPAVTDPTAPTTAAMAVRVSTM